MRNASNVRWVVSTNPVRIFRRELFAYQHAERYAPPGKNPEDFVRKEVFLNGAWHREPK